MTTFEFFQIFVDIVFLFLILLLVVGRAWKKSPGGGGEKEHESYREMISTLSVLIKEMKETSADLQERIGEKQVEVARTLAAMEERMEKLRNAVPTEVPPAKPLRASGEHGRRMTREAPLPAAKAEKPRAVVRDDSMTEEERKRAEEEKERKEKYRQVMDLADKGWSALDIARFTQVPLGEVDLLIRTKAPRR